MEETGCGEFSTGCLSLEEGGIQSDFVCGEFLSCFDIDKYRPVGDPITLSVPIVSVSTLYVCV